MKSKIKKYYPGFELAKDSGIIKLVKRLLKKPGFSFKYRASAGGSDANIFNKHGRPTNRGKY